MEVPRLGSNPSYQPMPQPQQCRIWASVTCTTAHGNNGSLTHWARKGIKPTTHNLVIPLDSFLLHHDRNSLNTVLMSIPLEWDFKVCESFKFLKIVLLLHTIFFHFLYVFICPVSLFKLLMNFITFIGVQQSSQPNFTAFPCQTLSSSPHSPTCLIWKS